MRFSFLLAATLGTSALFAQNAGGLSGTVFDPLGESLPQAEIVAANPTNGQKLTAISGAKGDFSITGMPPGNYDVTVLVYGSHQFEQKNVIIEPGKTFRLDVHLKEDGQLGAIGDNYIATAAIGRRPAPTGPTPMALDGHPDLSGVWAPTRSVSREQPDMLPWAAAEFKRRVETNGKDIPTSRCLPWGPTLDIPVTFKFVQAPTTLVMLFEDVFSYRQVHLDGRGHPKDADPTWMGHSIGKWEGETLVIDTAGMNDKSWSPVPYPHTEKFHMIEQIRRPDLGHLEIDVTIEDPDTYRKPWRFKLASTLLEGDEVGEYVCAENNQYIGHAQ